MGCKDKDIDLGTYVTEETVTRTLSGEDVYFIFTNTSLTSDAPASPDVRSNNDVSRKSAEYKPFFDSIYNVSSRDIADIWRKIDEFNKSDFKQTASFSRTISEQPTPMKQTQPADDIVGVGPETFYVDMYNTGDSVEATCRYVSPSAVNGVKLSIWVGDNDWEPNGGTITSDMVTAMANEFLFNGTDDIYKWVTDIYGVPWGERVYDNMIPDTEAGYITILLYDIDGDNSNNGGVVGYFWGKDNFLSSTYSGSNERIMFYIDSVLYSAEDSTPADGWQITDYWPQVVISTLAHEFQHMIHFYQKQIKREANYSETWLDEMCAMMTEDFVSDKLGIKGPRGILGTDYTAGLSEITNCRLSDYNYGNSESFLVWNYDDPNVFYDYATAYSFGAFLARNYGGTALFQDIVQSTLTDETAVVSAVNNLNGTSKTFSDLLIEWGKAVLLSDDPTTGDFEYNIGGKFDSAPTDPNGSSYSIGSINMFNYSTYIDDWADYLDGPVIYNYNIGNSISSAILAPGTNTFYLAGTNLTGEHSWTVEVPNNVTLTVVVK